MLQLTALVLPASAELPRSLTLPVLIPREPQWLQVALVLQARSVLRTAMLKRLVMMEATAQMAMAELTVLMVLSLLHSELEIVDCYFH